MLCVPVGQDVCAFDEGGTGNGCHFQWMGIGIFFKTIFMEIQQVGYAVYTCIMMALLLPKDTDDL
jgi:hypothetical protein